MKNITIYTDGSCLGNPGNGGWGTIIVDNGKEVALSGGEANTTNNRMELTAVINGLKYLEKPSIVKLYSDSKYICDAVNKGWVYAWKSKNWKKADGKPALNVDLWEVILELIAKHDVVFIWVKGHNGNKYNEKCDKLATDEAAKVNPKKSKNNTKRENNNNEKKQPIQPALSLNANLTELAFLLPKAEFAVNEYKGDDIEFVKMRLGQLVEVSKRILASL